MMPEMKPEVTAEPAQDIAPEAVQEIANTEVLSEPPPEVTPPAVPLTRWQRFLHWKHLGLFAIVLVTLILHFMAIVHPPTIVWDEIWYVGDVRSIISGTGEMRPEHPPLAKIFILAGEYIFNGFKTPEHDTGVKTYQYLGGDKDNDTTIDVSDASLIKIGRSLSSANSAAPVLPPTTCCRGSTYSPIMPLAGASSRLFSAPSVSSFSILFASS